MEPYEKLLVDTDFLEEDKHGQMLTCEKCHGGDPADNNWKTAHKGIVRDPTYPDPKKTCGSCHSKITEKSKDSLHSSLLPYKSKMALRMNPDKKVQAKVLKAMDTHCMGCHSSCGQCHVSRPKSVGGGLVEGHLFQKTPPVETNCTSCHGSRMEKEFFGKNEGVPADVHYIKGRWSARTVTLETRCTEAVKPRLTVMRRRTVRSVKAVIRNRLPARKLKKGSFSNIHRMPSTRTR